MSADETVMPVSLRAEEARRLTAIAILVEAEAQTWLDGFAVRDGDGCIWSKDDEWAHVRYVKLRNSAEYLRTLAKALVKRKQPTPPPCVVPKCSSIKGTIPFPGASAVLADRGNLTDHAGKPITYLGGAEL